MLSERGKLGISSINKFYLEENRLDVKIMSRGYAWLGTGITEAMQNASNFIKSIEDRPSLKISCIEEISSRRGFINEEQLKKIADDSPNEYGNCLKQLIAN